MSKGSLLTAAAYLALILPATAQDDVQAILAMPAMSVSQPGRISQPVEAAEPASGKPVPLATAPARPAPALPAPAPVATETTITQTVMTGPAVTAAMPTPPTKPVVPQAQAAAAPAEQAQQPQASTSMADILAKAYVESPTLRASREELRQQYENVALAESNRRPVVTADGGIAWTGSDSNPGGRDHLFGRDISVNATQFLYRGGRTLAEIDQQLALSDATIAAYDGITQDTFLNVIVAAMDIQRERATIELTEQNRKVIERQLQTSQRGFDVGELTRTDVAQSQSRLAGAQAQLVAAQAAFSNAVARFRQYAGQDGENLVVPFDYASLTLPPNIDSAEDLGEGTHPLIRQAVEAERAAQSTIRLAEGGLKPTVQAQGGVGKAWEQSTLLDDVTTASLGLRASVPLYEAGAIRAQIRQAKYGKREQESRVEEAKRAVRQLITTAWNNYKASLIQIDARNEQVRAAEVARNGVYREREVGQRTVLDTLDADNELLNAQVGQVQAQRDAAVAAYTLLAATGQLTGAKLGLFNVDAEKARRNAAQKAWLGTGISAAD